ncbi:aminodeoxychorismate synthase component I [Dyella sp.]|uniref:aminodeoxychorismate synthase component I n=1 Tax=Dyella sp. TaxID=1869338 RepID=UPI002D786F03|nr:aminodeoxychorismate synthase component I [Dyella sp.]HET6433933.1 aminodeoxychorismate synthase component I [Dyella sp.]
MTCHRRRLSGQRDLLALAAAFPERYAGLLQSVVHATPQARFDILFVCAGERLELGASGELRDERGAVVQGSFLDALDARWRALQLPCEPDDALPFRGGWLLFLAYELAGQIEPRLALDPPATMPVALALRCPAAAIIDHHRGDTTLVAEAGHEALLDQVEHDLERAPPRSTVAFPVQIDEDPPARFLEGVARIHDYLRAGDIFQANLSRAWRARYAAEPAPAALYEALRCANPAPFAGLLQQPGWAVVSSSPERLVESRAGLAQTRPIAGTRPRVAGDDESARILELSAHPKERAEHVMLIDLERNDLGRVCAPGTVEVDELMVVESYAHVHHIVSNVRGRLRPQVTPGQLIAATFPGGTITGCPKVRCMEIIAELEDAPRGAYTGAMGYLDRNGDMDLNILIRTLAVVGDTVTLRAGAGIVADSVAAAELDETRAKARGLLRALGATD